MENDYDVLRTFHETHSRLPSNAHEFVSCAREMGIKVDAERRSTMSITSNGVNVHVEWGDGGQWDTTLHEILNHRRIGFPF